MSKRTVEPDHSAIVTIGGTDYELGPPTRPSRVQRPKAVRARYLRIQATPSAFGGWLFTDEIVVQ